MCREAAAIEGVRVPDVLLLHRIRGVAIGSGRGRTAHREEWDTAHLARRSAEAADVHEIRDVDGGHQPVSRLHPAFEVPAGVVGLVALLRGVGEAPEAL